MQFCFALNSRKIRAVIGFGVAGTPSDLAVEDVRNELAFLLFKAYSIMPGPTQASPIIEVPSGGALASAISSRKIVCSIRPPAHRQILLPRKPTHPLARTFSNQVFKSFYPVLFRGKFSLMKLHLLRERQVLLCGVIKIHYRPPKLATRSR